MFVADRGCIFDTGTNYVIEHAVTFKILKTTPQPVAAMAIVDPTDDNTLLNARYSDVYDGVNSIISTIKNNMNGDIQRDL